MRALNDLEFDNFRSFVKCRWLECFAGLGLAGHGICCARGAWDKENCPDFETEEDFLERWEKEVI